MPDDPLARVVAAALAAADPTPDPDLLHRFAETRDPAAFELLVRRHADLVWRVCRGVLPGDHHRAEDAFQATFLALARKAHAIRGSTAGWLFRVARHAALRARAKAARHPGPLTADVPAGATVDPTEATEATAAVAEEVDRLPAKFRDPVVLCLLQGLTHAEAAARLGWPIGTVASRLSRARGRLRARLERRGVGVPAFGAVIGADKLTAGADLIRATVLVGVGGRPVPAAVASLTAGVIAAMHTSKLVAVLAVVAVGVAGTGTAWVLAQDKGPGQPAPAAKVADPPPAAPVAETWPPPSDFPEIPRLPDPSWKIGALMPKVLPVDSPVVRNRKRALLAAHAEFTKNIQVFLMGAIGQSEFEGFLANNLAANRSVASAAADLWAKPDDLRPWLEWRVAAAKHVELTIIERTEGGLARPQNLYMVVRDRLDAELALLKLNAK